LNRGYGVSALIDPEFIAPLAIAAERGGYSTFWVNDVPGGNGLEQLQRAQAATSAVRLGVGVLPVDRWSADAIASETTRLRLDPERVVIGIGAGALHAGSLEATRTVARLLIERLPVHVLIGALGPAMCRLAGSDAHGVILNWLTPTAAAELGQLTRDGAESVGGPSPEIVAYVRTAADPRAQDRLGKEASSYEGYPAYHRHFARMGVTALETTVNGTAEEIDHRFGAYATAVDELVARAITAGDTQVDYLTVLDAARPNSLRR
jgi:alkanesulfonate monooxygenase SsuD/methylene tetrahydromethanopterin reductase-like flavin-dependent oxidoreductase (luciferase family)